MTRTVVHLLVLSIILIFSVISCLQPSFADISQSDVTAVSTSVINSLSFPGMPADANLRVPHVAIVEDYAIADWRLGDGGGQELLHYNNGVWRVVTGGGGAMDTSDLIQAGVPEAIAMALIQQIQAQWQQ